MRIASLSIRAKLTCNAVLFLVSIALLVTLFWQQSFKDVNFGRKEADGVVYLEGVWPVLQGLVISSTGGSIATTAGAELSAVARTYDGAMGSAEASAALKAALAKV